MTNAVQSPNKPLYPNVIFNRPETKALAGKLLIIGGNIHSVATPSLAYNTALQYGAGDVRVVLPDATKPFFAQNIPQHLLFAPSNDGGSFSKEAIGALLVYSQWANSVVLVGDFSKNSETAIVIDTFIQQYGGLLTISNDALSPCIHHPESVLNNENNIIIASFTQWQKLAANIPTIQPFTSTMFYQQLYEAMQPITARFAAYILFQFKQSCIMVHEQHFIRTIYDTPVQDWSTKAAISASIWRMQQPSIPLEAIASSLTQLDI